MPNLAELDFEDMTPFPSNIPDGPALHAIAPVNPVDPSVLGYPPTLLVELAMRTSPLEDVLAAYRIDAVAWETIRTDPLFNQELARVVESLKEDGAGFAMKAKLQAESLLKTSWEMIHNVATPPAVRADLIKYTMKVAGCEPTVQSANTAAVGPGFSISINFASDTGPRVVNDA